MNIYDFTVLDQQEEETALSDYSGQVLLVVNTATGCGFTPQYEGLEALYRKYHARGFSVLDFPCDQFGHQAPGSDEEIQSFCTAKYDTTFPRFHKLEVNGKNEAPLYRWLKAQKGGFLNESIKWNFTKFLIDRNGAVIKRYAPTVKPEAIEKDILSLL